MFYIDMQNCGAIGTVAVFSSGKNCQKLVFAVEDLKHLTNFNNAGTLEIYDSVYNKYCPKRLHFSYPAMIARVELAALGFNAGV